MLTTCCIRDRKGLVTGHESRRSGRAHVTASMATAFAVVITVVGGVALSGAQAAEQARVKRVKVKAAGISVQYPASWLRFDLSKRDIKSLTDAARAENSELLEGVDPRAEAKATQLFSENPADGDNLQLVVVPGMFVSDKSALEDALRESMSDVPGFRLESTDTAKVGARRTFRADYRYDVTLPDGTVLPIFEVLLSLQQPGSNDRIAILTVTVDDTPTDISIADAIVRSVRTL